MHFCNSAYAESQICKFTDEANFLQICLTDFQICLVSKSRLYEMCVCVCVCVCEGAHYMGLLHCCTQDDKSVEGNLPVYL